MVRWHCVGKQYRANPSWISYVYTPPGNPSEKGTDFKLAPVLPAPPCAFEQKKKHHNSFFLAAMTKSAFQ